MDKDNKKDTKRTTAAGKTQRPQGAKKRADGPKDKKTFGSKGAPAHSGDKRKSDGKPYARSQKDFKQEGSAAHSRPATRKQSGDATSRPMAKKANEGARSSGTRSNAGSVRQDRTVDKKPAVRRDRADTPPRRQENNGTSPKVISANGKPTRQGDKAPRGKKNYYEIAFDILSEVYEDNAYAQVALNRHVQDNTPNKATVTKLVYGVIERSGQLDRLVARYVDKDVKINVKVILKMALYTVIYLDSIPDYALCNMSVELAKKLYKGAFTNLVNAVVRKIIEDKESFEKEDTLTLPAWLEDRIRAEYGEEVLGMMKKDRESTDNHIRVNTRKYSLKQVLNQLDKNGRKYRLSSVGGLYAEKCNELDSMFATGKITYQSPSSVLVCRAVAPRGPVRVLDMCAAPGGKSVLLSEMDTSARIDACDVHAHRVSLIEKYAQRMFADNVFPKLSDALTYSDAYYELYDYALCDVPCSGTGVIHSKADILLTITEQEIENLTKKQSEILSVAAKYLKRGGVLVYSTCSILQEEGKDIIAGFLSTHPEFKLEKMDIPFDNDGELQLLPDEELDGFYIARMRKAK